MFFTVLITLFSSVTICTAYQTMNKIKTLMHYIIKHIIQFTILFADGSRVRICTESNGYPLFLLVYNILFHRKFTLNLLICPSTGIKITRFSILISQLGNLMTTVSRTTRWKVLWESSEYNSPQKRNLFFCRQQLATLATPTIRSIKCKQLPVYRVFWPLRPHPSTNRNKTRTWSSLSPQEPSHKIWYKSVYNLFSYRGHSQTHKPTPVKTYSLAFAGRTKMIITILMMWWW